VPQYARPLAQLIESLERLPGIGLKSAQRLAFWLLQADDESVQALAAAIANVKRAIRDCSVCFNYTDEDLCPICADARRDHSQVCVVADARDLMALERSGEYRGVYHVLQGLLSPIEGVMPDNLRIAELLERVKKGGIAEVILATPFTVEGDATASYIADLLQPLGVRVTRIAGGLPVGGDLDYADQVTIARALEGRRRVGADASP
jgi:recombination protein RecR